MMKKNFNGPHHCALCGSPMLHSRNEGYRCMSAGHRAVLDEIYQLADYEDDKIEILIKIRRQEMGIVE